MIVLLRSVSMCFKLRHSGYNKITPGSQYSRLIEVVQNNPMARIKTQFFKLYVECRHASHYNSSVLWGNSLKIKTKLQATKNKRERSVDSGERKTFIQYCLFVSNSHSHRRRIVLRHYSILIGAKVCSAFVWSENSFNWKECNYFAFVPRTNVISNNSNNGRIVVTKMLRKKTSRYRNIKSANWFNFEHNSSLYLFAGNGILSLRLLSSMKTNH